MNEIPTSRNTYPNKAVFMLFDRRSQYVSKAIINAKLLRDPNPVIIYMYPKLYKRK